MSAEQHQQDFLGGLRILFKETTAWLFSMKHSLKMKMKDL